VEFGDIRVQRGDRRRGVDLAMGAELVEVLEAHIRAGGAAIALRSWYFTIPTRGRWGPWQTPRPQDDEIP